MDKKKKEVTYQITPKGSLGVLAHGDVGLRAWRKVRDAEKKEKK